VIVYLGAFIKIFFDLLSFLITVRVLLSWFPNRPHNALFDVIFDVTNPIMRIAKSITPSLGMIDISPIVALLAIYLIQSILLVMLSYS